MGNDKVGDAVMVRTESSTLLLSLVAEGAGSEQLWQLSHVHAWRGVSLLGLQRVPMCIFDATCLLNWLLLCTIQFVFLHSCGHITCTCNPFPAT